MASCKTKLEELIMGFDLHGEREFKNAPDIDWDKEPSFEEKEDVANRNYERVRSTFASA